MDLHRDLNGYYATLGVDVSASPDTIKRSFRAKAHEFHPDRNPSPEATQQFQRLNEAHQVLSDPEARAEYDALSREETRLEKSFQPGNSPVECSVCGKVSTQLRYAVFHSVVSFVVGARENRKAGIVCADCGAKRACASSLLTWLAGWWGIPFGPIHSARALVRNLTGGEQIPLRNFRMLGRQTGYFAFIRRMDLARQVADQALEFVHKIAPQDQGQVTLTDWKLRDYLLKIQKEIPLPPRRKKDRWGKGGPAFRVQAAMAILALAVVVTALGSGIKMLRAEKAANPGLSLVSETETIRTGSEKLPPVPPPPTGILERASDDGRSDRALAPLQIITAKDGPSFYLRLTDVATNALRLVIFVRSGDVTTIEVPIGTYQIRYAQGQTWYGEERLFGPQTTYGQLEKQFEFLRSGDQVEGYTLELVEKPKTDKNDLSLHAKGF